MANVNGVIPINYRECEGVKGGKLITSGDGYFYYKNFKRDGGYNHLLCRRTSCRGSARIEATVTGMCIAACTAHTVDCEPDLHFEDEVNLRKKILLRCSAETTPLRRIFHEECNREPPAIAARLTYPQMLSAMKRSRRKVIPPIPDSYQLYEELLDGHYEDTDGRKYFYKRIGEGEEESIIFIVEPIKDVLIEAREIHLDGTFKVVPNLPPSRQLFTLLAMKNEHAFPVVFALMRSKTTNAYIFILDYLKEKYPEVNPRLVISDYEIGIKSAVKRVFPNATHKGCWFHFAQCIFRRVQRLGLQTAYVDNEAVKKTVKMIIALALMPHYLIERGFAEIIAYAQDIRDTMEPLFTYFRTYWIENVGCQSFSVYGHPRRTNNAQESFHRMLYDCIGKAHPNVWEFTEAIKEISSSALRDHVRMVQRGVSVSLNRKRKWILQDLNIQRQQTNLVLNNIQPTEFLSSMTHRISRPALQTVGDDVDEGLTPLTDEMNIHTVPPAETNEEDDGLDNSPPIAGTRPNRNRGRGRHARGRAVERSNNLERIAGDLPSAARARGHGRAWGVRRGHGGRRGRGGREGAVNDVVADNEDNQEGVRVEDEQSPYVSYRTVAITLLPNTFMPLHDVLVQQEELRTGLQNQREDDIQCEDGDPNRCSVCKISQSTRVCSPCGHAVMCRGCAEAFVNFPMFHDVTTATGDIVQTHIRLPLTCPTCRAIIGQLIRVYGI